MKKLSTKEQIKALKQASQLLKGGIPLVKAMEVASFPQKAVELVTGGSGVSNAIEPFFSEGVAGLIGIGERSGDLEGMFNKAADDLERKDGFKKKITKALSYPLIVLSVSLMSLAAFIYIGLPKMKDIFVSFGLPLPRTLVIMSGLSGMIVPFAAAALLLFIGTKICNRKKLFLRQKEAILFGLPFFGTIAVKLETSVIMRGLSVLLGSGMPLLQSLEEAKRSLRSVLIAEALSRLALKISQGQRVSEAFGSEKYFEKNTVKMIEAAEEAAYLDRVFASAADMLEEEAHDSIRTFTLLIEPLSTVMVGVIVGFVVVSMFSPMMQILSAL